MNFYFVYLNKSVTHSNKDKEILVLHKLSNCIYYNVFATSDTLIKNIYLESQFSL